MYISHIYVCMYVYACMHSIDEDLGRGVRCDVRFDIDVIYRSYRSSCTTKDLKKRLRTFVVSAF